MKIKFTKKMVLGMLLCASAVCVSTETYANALVKLGKAAAAVGKGAGKAAPALSKTATTAARAGSSSGAGAYVVPAAAAGAYAASQQRGCQRCGGTGWIPCSACFGNGYIVVGRDVWGNPITKVCDSCFGNRGWSCSH